MTWAGATLFESADGGSTYQVATASTNAATIGAALTTLGNFGGGNVFDELSTVNVILSAGFPLVSYTEAQVLNGAGMVVLGAAGRWELLQYKVATLVAPRTYRLSGLLRGRRGSEFAMGLHAAGDTFVFVNAAAWKRPNPGTSSIGLARLYKPVTSRATLASATPQTFTNSAVGLLPYSVVQIGGGRDGAGDFLIRWTRRGRLAGEWRDSVDVPVSESSETYEVDIWNAERTTLLRTLTATSPTATYSAAEQATDGISSADNVSVSVYQLSAVVGRGRGARALLPGGETVVEAEEIVMPPIVVEPPPTAPTPTLFVATTGSDSNAGTSVGAPFLTIAHASSVAVPGDIISVADGVYTGGFQTTKDGTLAAPITFVSATRWGAKIKPPTSSSSVFGWDSFGDYVVIDGIEVDGTNDPTSGTRWRIGLRVSGEGSIVKNCHAHDIDRNGPATSNGGAGILLDSFLGGFNMKALSNRVHHVGPTGGSLWHQGIYFTASGEVKNNVCFANTGGGIQMWHDGHHIDVANNTCFFNGEWGIVYGGGDYGFTTGPMDYITITNNICYGNGVGIRELGDLGAHNLISNNLCNANGTNYVTVSATLGPTITGDPLFVDYQTDGSGDYHLQSTSPAIGTGLATYAPVSDYDELARRAPIDVGAYAKS